MHYYQEQYVIMKATMPSDTNLPNILQRTFKMMFMFENEVHSNRKSCSRSVGSHFGHVD